MSSRRRRRCHSLSGDSEEASGNHADPGPEPEPEELDWDNYSTTLDHRLAAVGNSCWFQTTVDCRVCVLITTPTTTYCLRKQLVELNFIWHHLLMMASF